MLDPAAWVDLEWHRMGRDDALAQLASRCRGLSEAEASRRLRRWGENALVVSRPTPWWRILMRQLRSFIVLLLAAAVVGAFLVGDRLEAIAIGAVLLLNTGVGFSMELWARQAMEALRRLEVQRATVRRNDRTLQIDARALVPGDVILVEAGEAVPADARLLEATELQMIEAPLTGESAPVLKTAARASAHAESIPLAERSTMLYKGTLAAVGSGEAVVVATGAATEIGRITELVLETPESRSPLERRLDVLGRRLVWIALAIAGLVAGLGILRREEWWLMVETGIALAIAAIPEGLPVVATMTLAVGMRRMARRNALVRRLSAVETLGSATVICSDKTGTLTAGEMTVVAYRLCRSSIEVTGSGYGSEGEFRVAGEPVEVRADPDLSLAIRAGALANRADIADDRDSGGVRGDPTEAALLVAARKAGFDRRQLLEAEPEVGQVPFSSERMLMATFHDRPEGGRVVYVKGAPDRVLELSHQIVCDGANSRLDAARRRQVRDANDELASGGLRVLALAYRTLGSAEEAAIGALRHLTFIALVGITDPPAPRVEATVRGLAGAGIRTVMITGDQAKTALAVGRQLGLVDSAAEVLPGDLLSQASGDEVARRLDRVGVMSRVSPVDKLRVVEAFQSRGEIVAMIGDGVNDAPALKRADIGVAMGGRGTDVAKETADLVLRDDRLETLFVAVKEGRIIYDNIRKFVFYLFSCNLAEVLVLFIAGLVALPLPLLPLQILWLNLVTDVFPALALAAEPADVGVMKRPPRDPQATILSRDFLLLTGFYGATLTVATLAVFLWSLRRWEVEPERAVTLAFMTLALSQLLHVFNARSERPVIFGRRLFANGWVWGAIALTVGLQLLAVYEPRLSRTLQTTPLTGRDWGLVLLGSSLPLVVGQVWKLRGGRKGFRGTSG